MCEREIEIEIERKRRSEREREREREIDRESAATREKLRAQLLFPILLHYL